MAEQAGKLPIDKVLHFMASMLLAAGAYFILNNVLVAGIAALFVGISKEFIDVHVRKVHGWDEGMTDILADAGGIILFWIVAAAMIPKEIAG